MLCANCDSNIYAQKTATGAYIKNVILRADFELKNDVNI
jgi:hypothetical protein